MKLKKKYIHQRITNLCAPNRWMIQYINSKNNGEACYHNFYNQDIVLNINTEKEDTNISNICTYILIRVYAHVRVYSGGSVLKIII